MAEKLQALLPFWCSTHSAVAACEACEHAHRACQQYGATGFCHRYRCRRRAGSCSFLCCSRCRFEFSCRQHRSDADMSACSSVFQVGSSAHRCSSDARMRLCRKRTGRGWPARGWAIGLHALRRTHQPRRPASSVRSWQSTQSMHHSSEPTRCRHSHPSRTHKASL